MYANSESLATKEISGIKSSFSVSIHRSSVMNRYDSVAGSIVDALFARVWRRNRRRGRGDVSKNFHELYKEDTRGHIVLEVFAGIYAP